MIISLNEYIKTRVSRNPDKNKYKIIGKVVDAKTGRLRAATKSEQDPKNRTEVNQYLCYKNGKIVPKEDDPNAQIQQQTPQIQEPVSQTPKPVSQSTQKERVTNKAAREFFGRKDVYCGIDVHIANSLDEENITDAEFFSIGRYTGSEFKGLNRGLRKDLPLTKVQETMSNDISNVLERNRMQKDCILYRSFGSGKFLGDGLKPGLVFTEKGFSSTSTNPTVARNFNGGNTRTGKKNYMMVIMAPKGTKGASVMQYSLYKKEQEVLLDKGQRYQILSVDERNAVVVAKLINEDSDELEIDTTTKSPYERYMEECKTEKVRYMALKRVMEGMDVGEKISIVNAKAKDRSNIIEFERSENGIIARNIADGEIEDNDLPITDQIAKRINEYLVKPYYYAL